MMPTYALTGLCSWALKTMSGSFLGNERGTTTTCFLGEAYLFLWTPEEAQTKATELAPKIGRTELTAVRARP